jgi:hypothetical protein
MSCCGNKRNNFSGSLSSKETNQKTLREKSMWNDAIFEYTGPTGLTVKGNVTGKLYRFNFTGDTQVVDYRDTNGMIGISSLQKKD